MSLKGILWKPGINGLGVLGFHKLPYRNRFDRAAREHDRCYDIGEDRFDRFYFDVNFLRDCLFACDNDIQCFMAVVYFVFVRLFGWAFFRYNR